MKKSKIHQKNEDKKSSYKIINSKVKESKPLLRILSTALADVQA